MEFDIQGNPDYGQLRVQLKPGEKFIAEGGSMAWMDSKMQSKARLLGGFFRAMIRKVTGGESLFVGEYFSDQRGEAAFSPAQPGTVLQRTLRGDSIILTAGSFMACTPGVELSTKFGGLRGMFSGEGLFFMECSGQGELFFNSYGAIIEKDIDGSYVVDNGHAVAWVPTLEYRLTRAARIRSFMFSDQIIMEFEGTGKLWVQSRNPRSLADWVYPFRSVKSSNDN